MSIFAVFSVFLLRIVAVLADPSAPSADCAIPSALKTPPINDGDKMNDSGYDQRPAYTTVVDANGVQRRWKSSDRRSALIRVKHRPPVIIDLTDVIATDVQGFRNGEDVRDDHEYNGEGSHYSSVPGAAGGSHADGYYVGPGWRGEIERPFGTLRPVDASTADHRKGIGFWTMAKIALAVLKTFKAIKLLTLVAVKLKLLSLFAFFLFAKLLVAGKAALKLLLLPFFLGCWSGSLLNAHNFWSAFSAQFSRNTTAATSVQSSGQSRDIDGWELKTFVDHADQSLGATFVPKLVQFVTSVQAARCVERTACHAASFTAPGFGSIWLSGILPSLIDYIPYRKLKLYMTTFKKVSDTRLEDILIEPSTEEWLKWCDEHYQCKDKSTNEIDD